MKFFIKILAGTFLLIGPSVSAALADEVTRDVLYLRKGQVVYGKILDFVPGDHLRIQTKDGVVEYLVEEVDRIAKETVPVEGEKMPALSGILSVVVPGVGQYYNGQIVKGLIIDGSCLAGLLLAFDSVKDGVIVKREENSTGAILYFGAWLFSVIDAPITAVDINSDRKKVLYGGGMASLTKSRPALGFHFQLIDPRSMRLAPGGELAFRF